jgi:glycosyltransferase involved in cell wall biosynthesis/GNAT superfamily N-acetyltransferase
VLWVVKGLGPGGAERLLCAAARAHDRTRFHIECAFVLPYKDHLAEELERAGVRTHCLSRKRSDYWWPLRLVELVRDGEWDIVHSHSPLPGSVARLATRTIRKPDRPKLVSTEHNRWATHRGPTRWLNTLTSRWDDVSFAVTDEVRGSMTGAVARRVETLQHGIDVEAVAKAIADRAAVRDELGIGDDEIVVGTVANFRPQKDYPNLLQAARLLADREVPVRVVAVGQGPQEAEIRRLRDDLGLTDRVMLTGFRDDAVRVMGACDIFTLASQWEGLPVALMEAVALGLPVVATDVGGVGEEMHDGVDALLVPPRDPEALAAAIERVVTDAVLRDELAKASAVRAADFDVRRAVERIETAYAELAPEAAATRTEPAPSSKRRPLPQGLNVREATPADRPAIIELCRASLGWGDDPRFEQLFSWKHDQNAFGPSYLWVATDGDRIVGLRAFMRWEFVRGGHVLHAVRAVDTATHPDYQGKGLFTAMTLHGLDEIRADGVDFVFNTPNDKSRPGYLKMGWQEVGKLPVALRVAGPRSAVRMVRSRVASSHWPLEADFGVPVTQVVSDLGNADASAGDRSTIATNTSTRFYDWRYGADFLGYRAVTGDGGHLVCRVRQRGDAKELVMLDSPGLAVASADRLAGRLLRANRLDHALRIGAADARYGFVPAPGGPVVTWRSVCAEAMPPLANWHVGMGDVELF